MGASDNAVILVVEDDENDIRLIQTAFARGQLANPVHFVRTGELAVAYLAGKGQYANRAEHPLPVLVLLDLNLPGMDGFEVLSWIRRQEGLRGLPVLVLTCSNLIRDVNRAYALGANSFFTKDIDFQKSAELAKLLREYWLERALTPETCRSTPNLAR